MTHLIIVSLTTVAFGIASLLLISRARNKLSEGSIKQYMDNFAICLAFIVIFSIWQTIRNIYGASAYAEESSHYLTYFEYIFLVFAYIAFIIASYRVAKISEEFGFKGDGGRIEQLIKEKQKTRRTKK